MSTPDKDIEALESSFPAVSGQVFAAEHRKALAAGFSVLQAEGGVIYRVFPDGRREPVKQIKAPVSVPNGRKFRIR